MHGLWITLGILTLLAIGLARIRLGVFSAFGPQGATAKLVVGPFSIQLVPQKEKKKPEKKKPAASPKSAHRKKSATSAAKCLKELPLRDSLHSAMDVLIPAGKKALRRTRRSIRLDPLTISLTVGGAQDPASAAEQYGKLHMAVWTVMPPLEQMISIPHPSIHVGIDFDAAETKTAGEIGLSIRLGTLLAVGMQLGIPAVKWFLKEQKKAKKQNSQKPAPENPVGNAAA